MTIQVSGGIVLVTLGAITLPSSYQGVSIPIVMGLTLLILLPFMYNNVALAASMPRSGGDYIFGSRVVHPVWGMIPGFFQLFSFLWGGGTIGVAALQGFFAPAIITAFPQYSQIVSSLVFTPYSELALNIVIIVFCYGIAMVGTRWWFHLLRTISYYGLAMVILLIAFILITPTSTLASNFSAQHLTGFDFNGVISDATKAGWSPNSAPSSGTWAGALVFLLLFLAAPISVFISGEVKNAPRSYVVGLVGAGVFAWILSFIGMLAIISTFGYNFMSAFGFEAYSNPITAATGTFSAPTLISAVFGNPIIVLLVGLGIALAFVGFLAGAVLPASRILFALSFDRVIPAKFAEVSSTRNTPLFTLGFATVMAILVGYLTTFYATFLGPFLALAMFTVLAFFPNGITAALFPFRRKEIYNSAPHFVRWKIGGVPVLSISGVLHAFAFGSVLVLMFLDPAFAGTSNGTLGPGTIATTLGLIFIAVMIYPISKAIRKREGIDLGAVYKEIPPE